MYSSLTLIPTGAFAAGNTVTIESERNDALDYLEYYKDGSWHDLNTPKHVIEQTGEICYCVEHSKPIRMVTPIQPLRLPQYSGPLRLQGFRRF